MRVAVLGSTGSIGRQALDVAALHQDRIEIVALCAHSSHEMLLHQARTFGVSSLALSEPAAAASANALVRIDDPFDTIMVGADAVSAMASREDIDIVLNALVGAAGLGATTEALAHGKTLALANKESLVIGGDLIMPTVSDGQLIPVDSEHSAIFQCLLGEDSRDASRIWLTASGGPFYGRSRSELAKVTAPEALAHPTWNMGPKITIDSATLMNKGLEVIEAHHLFGMSYDSVRVVVHRQSCVHSMVEFSDGSVIAHLGATDMRIPIQYAFSHPRRWRGPAEPVDFAALGQLDFAEPDLDTFGCLQLAFQAGRAGGSAPVVLNAANEVAVAAFLESRCGFLGIEGAVDAALGAHAWAAVESIEHIEDIDAWSRQFTRAWLGSREEST